ncbi:MAG: hypothetical protein ACOC0U_03280 [Desulfovibrionales bacterium]
MLMFAKTATRVEDHTDPDINEQIRKQTERDIELFSKAGPEAIEMRLDQLDQEWDIERTLETNAAGLSLLGLGLGTFVNKKWYALSAVVAGFLLQHGIQGWCPPVPVFRRLGIRTMSEIDYERRMLMARRGDFAGMERTTDTG